MLSRRRGVNTTMTTINHTPAVEQRGKKRLIHRFSWVSLLVCWLIWVLNAYDREMILRLGPVISKEFSLSPEQWGNIVALIMVALAVLDIPGSIWSDRYGSGWKRARFQVPLVLGYTALSFISGIKAISHGLTAFVLLRVGVNLGAGWGEPVGVSNTAEWWPKEKRGFALGGHHTGYPIGALLSGVVASLVLATFGEGSWRYCFLLALLVAIPLMIFWAKYSTADRINTLYQHIDSQGLTRPATQESSHVAKGEGMKTFLRTLRNRNISLTAGNTLLTQIVYMGINVVLPPYLYHVSGLSLAASAGLSIIFTLTGTLGQVIWPWLSDSFGRKRTLIVCGLWMSIGRCSISPPICRALSPFSYFLAWWPTPCGLSTTPWRRTPPKNAPPLPLTELSPRRCLSAAAFRHCLWAGSFSLAAAGKIQRVISTPSLPWRDVRCWGCYYSS